MLTSMFAAVQFSLIVVPNRLPLHEVMHRKYMMKCATKQSRLKDQSHLARVMEMR